MLGAEFERMVLGVLLDHQVDTLVISPYVEECRCGVHLYEGLPEHQARKVTDRLAQWGVSLASAPV